MDKSTKSEKVVRNVEATTECNIMEINDVWERSKGPTVATIVGRLSRMKIENKPLDMITRQ